MNLVELSNWEWLVILFMLMVVVWLLVLFQIRQSMHEVQLTAVEDHGSDGISHSSEHSESNKVGAV